MNIARHLVRAGLSSPREAAIAVGAEVRWSYRELAERAARLAGSLRAARAFAAGDRVALFMKNTAEYLEILYGAWHAGLVAVPINAKLHPREVAFILENSGARLAFATAGLAGPLAEAVEEIPGLEGVVPTDGEVYREMTEGAPLDCQDRAPDDPAWLFYTSGTTGRPKGVTITHRNLMAMALNYFVDVGPIAPGDCIVHAAPLSHGSGIYALPHIAAAADNVIPDSGGFDPAEVVALLARHRGATLFAAPTMVRRLVDHLRARSADLSNLKTIVYGGGPMYVADLKEALAVLGDRLVQIYGQGESPMTITHLSRRFHADHTHPRHEERLGSVGVADTVVEVRVVDGEGRPLPTREVGEVALRGDTVMAGYWGNPEATAETLRDGWLHTGDVGYLDADGFLYLKDRSKDLIISGGSNIYPREVEEALLADPGVAEASVVGRPHGEWGEEVVAFVVRAPGAAVSAEDLDAACLARIARFKRPKTYRFVEALPKNNYGKVLKTELRERLAAEDGG